jgi:hypothetical protein
MRYLILWFRIFFGVHLLYSTLRHYLTSWQAIIPGVGGQFVDSLIKTGLYEVVKFTEGVVGLCLVLNLFVPLVLVIEFPISVVIFFLNFLVVAEGYQVFTGLQEVFLNGLLLIFYGGYYRPMLKAWAPAGPPWRRSPRQES